MMTCLVLMIVIVFMVCCKTSILTTRHEEYCKIRDQNAPVESMKFAAFSIDSATFDK